MASAAPQRAAGGRSVSPKANKCLCCYGYKTSRLVALLLPPPLPLPVPLPRKATKTLDEQNAGEAAKAKQNKNWFPRLIIPEQKTIPPKSSMNSFPTTILTSTSTIIRGNVAFAAANDRLMRATSSWEMLVMQESPQTPDPERYGKLRVKYIKIVPRVLRHPTTSYQTKLIRPRTGPMATGHQPKKNLRIQQCCFSFS